MFTDVEPEQFAKCSRAVRNDLTGGAVYAVENIPCGVERNAAIDSIETVKEIEIRCCVQRSWRPVGAERDDAARAVHRPASIIAEGIRVSTWSESVGDTAVGEDWATGTIALHKKEARSVSTTFNLRILPHHTTEARTGIIRANGDDVRAQVDLA